MSQITDTIGSGLRKTGDIVADAGKATSNTVSDGYDKATGNSSKSHGLNLKNNSGYSQDAKDMARDAEKMKDRAMRDADKRFG
jgi:exo-beta-1,3-glucanase (GH17 family)